MWWQGVTHSRSHLPSSTVLKPPFTLPTHALSSPPAALDQLDAPLSGRGHGALRLSSRLRPAAAQPAPHDTSPPHSTAEFCQNARPASCADSRQQPPSLTLPHPPPSKEMIRPFVLCPLTPTCPSPSPGGGPQMLSSAGRQGLRRMPAPSSLSVLSICS